MFTRFRPPSYNDFTSVAAAAATFDFVGIFPDDSSDEVGTVQIPNSWRTVIIDPNAQGPEQASKGCYRSESSRARSKDRVLGMKDLLLCYSRFLNPDLAFI